MSRFGISIFFVRFLKRVFKAPSKMASEILREDALMTLSAYKVHKSSLEIPYIVQVT